MAWLELKVPPPAVAFLVCAAMWASSLVLPVIEAPLPVRAVAALAIACIGGIFSLAGGIRFRRAGTTVNPIRPEKASSLVSSGVYRITRNPMYVGLLLVVVAWAVFLASPWSLVGPLAFLLYIDRFQIAPEERALHSLFGAEYEAYRSRVRRWL
jgi:protein-S-isoprenylcysteine O-methyltransferase Ste14